MGYYSNAAVALMALLGCLSTGCINYMAVEDFSSGASEFSNSYDDVYSGTYDTCVSSSEIRSIILDLGETPTRSPLTQLSEDQETCASYKPVTRAFSETSLALSDFSEALALSARSSELGSFRQTQFVPRFSGIDESLTETVPELSGQAKQIASVNKWKDYLQSFFVQKTPQEVILETGPEVTATLELLGTFAEIYESQLDNYGRNIKVLDTLVHDTESKDVVQRAFVMNRSKEEDRRQELLDNYTEALEAVKESYKQLYERSELGNPRYGDPIFQQNMKEFMIRISSLTQQAKLI